MEVIVQSRTDNNVTVLLHSKILNGNINVQVRDENNNSLKDIELLLILNDN